MVSITEQITNTIRQTAADGASEAATKVVHRGIVAYAAISLATLAADKIMPGLFSKLLVVGGVSFLASRHFKKG